MGLELTSDRYPPIRSQTRYPLRHAACNCFERDLIVIRKFLHFCTIRMEVQGRKNSVSKVLEDYKLDNQRFMQEMNNTITQGKQDHIALSNEVTSIHISFTTWPFKRHWYHLL